MDLKCPASGECGSTRLANLPLLRRQDEVKFIVADRADFDWAADFVRAHGLEGGPGLLFGAVADRLPPRDLAGWLLDSGLEARLQLQLHKLLWPERERGV
jgi:7-carboxy-7-deazaguanine synthase